jgi:hypothetical protein
MTIHMQWKFPPLISAGPCPKGLHKGLNSQAEDHMLPPTGRHKEAILIIGLPNEASVLSGLHKERHLQK